MDRMRRHQPYMPIEPRAGVSARCRLRRSITADGQQIWRSWLEMLRNIIAEADIDVRSAPEMVAVDPDIAVRHNPVKLNPHPSANGGHPDFPPIPSHPRGQPAARSGGGRRLVEFPLDAPVVRLSDSPPRLGIEARFLRAFRIPLKKSPAFIQRLDRPRARSGHRKQQRCEQTEKKGFHFLNQSGPTRKTSYRNGLMAEGCFRKREKSRGLIEVIRSPAQANSNLPEATISAGVDDSYPAALKKISN